ncbi:MAG: hypothetical protein ACMUIG_02575 [Thermoplasmatota archaeon]
MILSVLIFFTAPYIPAKGPYMDHSVLYDDRIEVHTLPSFPPLYSVNSIPLASIRSIVPWEKLDIDEQRRLGRASLKEFILSKSEIPGMLVPQFSPGETFVKIILKDNMAFRRYHIQFRHKRIKEEKVSEVIISIKPDQRADFLRKITFPMKIRIPTVPITKELTQPELIAPVRMYSYPKLAYESNIGRIKYIVSYTLTALALLEIVFVCIFVITAIIGFIAFPGSFTIAEAVLQFILVVVGVSLVSAIFGFIKGSLDYIFWRNCRYRIFLSEEDLKISYYRGASGLGGSNLNEQVTSIPLGNIRYIRTSNEDESASSPAIWNRILFMALRKSWLPSGWIHHPFAMKDDLIHLNLNTGMEIDPFRIHTTLIPKWFKPENVNDIQIEVPSWEQDRFIKAVMDRQMRLRGF